LIICDISLHMLKLLRYQADCVSSNMDTTASSQSSFIWWQILTQCQRPAAVVVRLSYLPVHCHFYSRKTVHY